MKSYLHVLVFLPKEGAIIKDGAVIRSFTVCNNLLGQHTFCRHGIDVPVCALIGLNNEINSSLCLPSIRLS